MSVSREARALADLQRESYSVASAGLLQSWPPEHAMGAEELGDFLYRMHYGVLATSRPDGRPHAAPVAYTAHDGALWVATVAGVRLRNLRATPWASLVVMEGEGDQHRALTVEGPVVIHQGDEFEATRAVLFDVWIKRHGRAPDWAVAFIELRAERVFSYAAPSQES